MDNETKANNPQEDSRDKSKPGEANQGAKAEPVPKESEAATGHAQNGARTDTSKDGGQTSEEAVKQKADHTVGEDSGKAAKAEDHASAEADKQPDLPVASEEGDEKRELEQRERKMQQQLLEAELKVLKLENELRQLNDVYTKKVTEKAAEAQRLLNKRTGELQDEFEKKTAEAKRYALRNGGTRLAEVLQQFEMVLTTSQKAGEAVQGYAKGFVMVFELMVKALSDLGVKEIPVKVGDPFDHDTMEIFEGVDAKEFQHNQVVEVIKKGYRLHDLVIAHAIVKVAN